MVFTVWYPKYHLTTLLKIPHENAEISALPNIYIVVIQFLVIN